MRVLLASRSPQRRALLEALGVRFDVVEPDVEEAADGDPREAVVGNALRKARTVAAGAGGDALVIAGDTEVVLDGRALGQPTGVAEARAGLEALSGRWHEVIGGLAVVEPGTGGDVDERSGVATSRVRFNELSEPLLSVYLRSGEWRGRAGGYAVQGLGSALVRSVEGDLSNVIGLPVALLAELAPQLLSSTGG